ncbi:MAG: beta-lactamase family protein [Fuerstia sp.]|nr:beta-lactamase family protein [Fuerstiella sp.]
MAFFAHVSWMSSEDWLVALGVATLFFVFLLVIDSFVYYVNQRAVRVQLEPRRQELLTLLISLRDETTSADSYDIVPASVSPFAEKSHMTPRRQAVGTVIGLLGLIGVLILVVVWIDPPGRLSESGYDGPPQSIGSTGDSLARLITDLRKEKKLAGLAAMVMVDGQVEAAVAHGERKIGSRVPVEIGDRWHLGGITSSITATMIGRLVESGRMNWTDTVGETFPEASIHKDWKPVTVRQLLTHTAGAPQNFSLQVRKQRPALGPECTEARRVAVLKVIADQPINPPGTKPVYSNVGPTIAGAMAEKATGVAWEDLVKREVFEPLELTGAGFGPPESPDETLPQPRGHRTLLGGKIAVDDDADNTPIMGPAATVHMTLNDLCNYATEHLRGDRGDGKLLSNKTYRLLHTPEFNQYACGWIRQEPNGQIPHTVFWHNGTNTLWYALVVFIPEKNMVVAVTSNDGDWKKAEAAAWQVVNASVMSGKVEAELPDGEDYPKKSPFAVVRWQVSR